MAKLEIHIAENAAAFVPGQMIVGSVAWELAEPADTVELQLRWSTRGKGGVDEQVVDRVRFDKPGARAEQPFQFRCPEDPISFSGKLISLIWSLRVVVLPAGVEAQQNITISPTGQEIDLYGIR